VSAAVPTDSFNLRQVVTVDGIRAHQQALQGIADANGGTRASGTPGYNDSADYVAGLLGDAGYVVTRQPFTFPFFQELSEAEFERLAPTPETYQLGEDFLTMEYSGSAPELGVTRPLVAVDVVLPPGAEPSTSTSGCEAADFAAFPEGAIALLQRGTCTFGEKAANAEAACAMGAIILNEANPAGKICSTGR